MIVHAYPVRSVRIKTRFDLAQNQQLLLMPVGDVHFLSEGWPKEKFIQHLRWGFDRGAFFLGMGEYIDLASETQRQIVGLLRDTTKKQFNDYIKEAVLRFLEPIMFTQHRWMGIMEGDHRWTFEDGTTADQMIADYLGAPFLGDAALTRITYPGLSDKHPEADCIVYSHHGFGSSRLAGGQLHRIEDLMKFIDADIYLMGHSHAKTSAPIDRQMITPDGVHSHRTKVIARTGAWMKAYTSHEPLDLKEAAVLSRATYAEKAAYAPAAMGGLAFGIGYEKIGGSEYYRPTIHYSV